MATTTKHTIEEEKKASPIRKGSTPSGLKQFVIPSKPLEDQGTLPFPRNSRFRDSCDRSSGG